MNIIFVLIPLGLMLLAVAVAAFFWAVSNGQFDDLDAQASRILFDDDEIREAGDPGETRKPAPDRRAA